MPSVQMALNSWKRRQFEYGDADCCQFAAFIVKEMTGKDYISQFTYDSEEKANELINGEGALVNLVGTVLGEPSDELKDGDPCVVDLPVIGQVCGIKYQNSVVCLTTKGMKQIPDRYLIHGWSV
tara:strand:- start:1967 stop:2338 length:372 start_codon:yes stop_codon:yes gene_type:complete